MNYTRTAFEYLLKSIAHHGQASIPFTLEPHKLNTEQFLAAISKLKKRQNGSHHVISYALHREIKALRKTVLNPLSHSHPNSITETEVRLAIELVNKLSAIEAEERATGEENRRLADLGPEIQNATSVGGKLNAIETEIRAAIQLSERLLRIEQSLPNR